MCSRQSAALPRRRRGCGERQTPRAPKAASASLRSLAHHRPTGDVEVPARPQYSPSCDVAHRRLLTETEGRTCSLDCRVCPVGAECTARIYSVNSGPVPGRRRSTTWRSRARCSQPLCRDFPATSRDSRNQTRPEPPRCSCAKEINVLRSPRESDLKRMPSSASQEQLRLRLLAQPSALWCANTNPA